MILFMVVPTKVFGHKSISFQGIFDSDAHVILGSLRWIDLMLMTIVSFVDRISILAYWNGLIYVNHLLRLFLLLDLWQESKQPRQVIILFFCILFNHLFSNLFRFIHSFDLSPFILLSAYSKNLWSVIVRNGNSPWVLGFEIRFVTHLLI